jgi:thiamine-monophosphate kinase
MNKPVALPGGLRKHLALGPGAEFDAVRALLARWGAIAVGIGDDAAVLDVPPGSRLVVSTDSSVENVHFKRAWISPTEIGWRAVQATLSDLAAMGASPLGLLIAMAVPAGWRVDLDALADGIGEAARASGSPILGGDVTDGDRLTLGITALGHATRPLSRGGAQPGDTLYVTGHLGGPGAAVAAWTRGGAPRAEHRARFAHPEARLTAGAWLSAHGASAALDLSDGLAGDAAHLAAASGVRCVIDVNAVPCAPGVSAPDALSGGEEYELLVSAPSIDTIAFARATGGLALTAIGCVEATDRKGGEVVATRDGTAVPLRGSHDHFAAR